MPACTPRGGRVPSLVGGEDRPDARQAGCGWEARRGREPPLGQEKPPGHPRRMGTCRADGNMPSRRQRRGRGRGGGGPRRGRPLAERARGAGRWVSRSGAGGGGEGGVGRVGARRRGAHKAPPGGRAPRIAGLGGGSIAMREIVHIQAGQCGNQIGTKVSLRGAGAAAARPPLSRASKRPGRGAAPGRFSGLFGPAGPGCARRPPRAPSEPLPRGAGRAGAARRRASRLSRDHKRLWEVPKPNQTF